MRKWLILSIVAAATLLWWVKQPTTKNDRVMDETTIEENLDQNITSNDTETLKLSDLIKYQPKASSLVEVEKIKESRYEKSIVTYESDGYTIRALLGIPLGKMVDGGWPVIIFNHGYIPPMEYRTNEKYVAYFDRLVLAGYVVVKSDYRGHGESEGEAEGGYGSDAYSRDIRNLVATMKLDSRINPDRVGMWGHSMGGHITLRNMVVDPSIKAGVNWAGVVASYPDLLNNWLRTRSSPLPSLSYPGRRWRNLLQEKYGTPEQNPEFWNSISATSYLGDISGPLELHHGTADTSVPIAFSRTLKEKMTAVNKKVELYEYPGDDHNISQNFGVAMDRTIKFFDEHLAKK